MQGASRRTHAHLTTGGGRLPLGRAPREMTHILDTASSFRTRVHTLRGSEPSSRGADFCSQRMRSSMMLTRLAVAPELCPCERAYWVIV